MTCAVVFKDALTIGVLQENCLSLKNALLEGGEVVADITGVERIDCAAAQMLVAAQKECAKGGGKICFRMSEAADRFLASVGIHL